jgi:Protein of unknown function (DUF3179)
LPTKPIFSHPAARWFIYAGVLLFASIKLAPVLQATDRYNGFDIGGGLVPAEKIEHGGPPRDGIPALNHPKMLPVSRAGYLRPADRVLGISHNGEARAYPIRLLNWHEVVNDTVGGKSIVITYCPLCGTGMIFAAAVDGVELEFGVSGLLYNSDMLLYDRQTESLWSQILAQAVSGPLAGTRMSLMAATYTNWEDWVRAHPDGLVLDIDTGYRRDYARDPYAGYDKSRSLYFDVTNRDPRYHEKEPVVGLVLDGQAKVWPLSELAKLERWPLTDSINDIELHISYRMADQSVIIRGADGRLLPSVPAYWFAWVAFYPDTAIFSVAE